jgi:hypothetical protein
MWRLFATEREPQDLDGQIDELLSKLTDDFNVWASIAEKYKLDLFCGLFMRGSNEGLSISPKSLAALGLRQIELGLDIYGGDDEDTGRPDPSVTVEERRLSVHRSIYALELVQSRQIGSQAVRPILF